MLIDVAKALIFFSALAILCSWLVGCSPAGSTDQEQVCLDKCRESLVCYQGKLSPACHQCVVDCLKAREPKADCWNGVCG